MRFQSQIMDVTQRFNRTVYRFVIAMAVLGMPCTMLLKLCATDELSIENAPVVAMDLESTDAPHSNASPIHRSRSLATISINVGETDPGQFPMTAVFQQQDETALSAAFLGQTFAPATLAISQRLTINNAVNEDDDTYLHLACRSGDTFMVWLLIEAGASSSGENRFGETPLDTVGDEDSQVLASITRMINHQWNLPTNRSLPSANRS